MDEGHQFDFLTDWCVLCGAGRAHVLEGRRAPTCEPGVIGISHLVASKTLAAVVACVSRKMRERRDA